MACHGYNRRSPFVALHPHAPAKLPAPATTEIHLVNSGTAAAHFSASWLRADRKSSVLWPCRLELTPRAPHWDAHCLACPAGSVTEEGRGSFLQAAGIVVLASSDRQSCLADFAFAAGSAIAAGIGTVQFTIKDSRGNLKLITLENTI